MWGLTNKTYGYGTKSGYYVRSNLWKKYLKSKTEIAKLRYNKQKNYCVKLLYLKNENTINPLISVRWVIINPFRI